MGTKIFGVWDVVCFVSIINLVADERKYVYGQDNGLCFVVFCDYGYTNIVEMT